MSDATALRSLREQFPVTRERAYLNAGTDGPVPAAAVEAAREQVEREAREGRARPHFERVQRLRDELRAAYAARLSADAADVSLTTSTTEGMTRVLAGIGLRPGDEAITSTDEHPGLLGPLAALRRRGVEVRAVPLADVADAVGPRTRLVACSHVGWMTGETAPAALAEVDVPVLLDGAQGAGAVPVDVAALGCAAYAAAGQKWLCGLDGLGLLWTSPALRAQLSIDGPGYGNLADPAAGLDAIPWADGRALDAHSLTPAALAAALASQRTLEAAGWGRVHTAAAALAARFAAALEEAGRPVEPRAATTLVSFASADPEGEAARLAEAGVVLRFLPGGRLLRASVGAWNDEEDLDRLLAALD